MKTITIQIPDDADEDNIRRSVDRLCSPSWLACWWSTLDILDAAGEMEVKLTEEKAQEIIKLLDKYHDAEQGINWSVIRYWIDWATT
jgi:hypothetical protein